MGGAYLKVNARNAACLPAILLLAWLAVLCSDGAAQAAAAPDAAPVPDAPAKKGKWISGWYETGLDAAWDNHDSDFDLVQTLKLDVTPPSLPRLRLRGLVWADADLDGDERSSSALRDIGDASDSDVRARLLYLYAEYDDLWGDSTLRLGRQRILESVTNNRIDGLYIKQRRAGWDWYAFAGAHAGVYYDTHNDLAAGGGVSWSPWPRTRLALDAYYREDDRDSDNGWPRLRFYYLLFRTRRIESDANDSLVALSVWQAFNENLHVFGRLRFQDGNADELSLQATGFVPSWDLAYELAFEARLKRAGDRPSDTTAFYRILDRYEQYQNYFIALHKPIAEKLTLSLEGGRRANGQSRLPARRADRRLQRDCQGDGPALGSGSLECIRRRGDVVGYGRGDEALEEACIDGRHGLSALPGPACRVPGLAGPAEFGAAWAGSGLFPEQKPSGVVV
jgi:hypothetical protein